MIYVAFCILMNPIMAYEQNILMLVQALSCENVFMREAG